MMQSWSKLILKCFQFSGNNSSGAGPQAVFTSFKLPKPGPQIPQEFPGMQVPVPSSSPFSFSIGSSVRPPPGQLGQFTTTTQFQTKPEPSNITSESPINLGLNNEAKKELHDSPTAQPHQQQAGNVQEDVQKIQENNNNNQSEGESNSEEVTPPKNQGLIKVRDNEQQPGNISPNVSRPMEDLSAHI